MVQKYMGSGKGGIVPESSFRRQGVEVRELRQSGVHIRWRNTVSAHLQFFEGVSFLRFYIDLLRSTAINLTLEFVEVIVGGSHFASCLIDHLLEIFQDGFGRLELAIGLRDFIGDVSGRQSLFKVLLGFGNSRHRILLLFTHDCKSTTILRSKIDKQISERGEGNQNKTFFVPHKNPKSIQII